jgi:LysM repeat protein
MMKRNALLFFSLLAAMLGLFALALPAAASPAAQVVYYTPTPRPDGRIIYVVKANDTCISIAILHKITEEQLRSLNNIRGTNCIIQVGQELLIGLAGPAESPTPGPSRTPTPLLPTATPLPGKATVCVVLFEDTNGNGSLEDAENALAGGAVSLVNRSGSVSLTGSTLDSIAKPLCFADITEGEYSVSIAAPQGYNPTTLTSRSLTLQRGDTSTLDFGAQISIKAPPADVPTDDTGTRFPLLGALGALLILGGIVFAIFWRRMAR